MGAYETERKSAHDFTKYTDCHIVNLYHFDVGMGMNKGWILKTELGIVIVLFVLNALKAYPERKKAIVFYVLLTLAAVVCFTLQFI